MLRPLLIIQLFALILLSACRNIEREPIDIKKADTATQQTREPDVKFLRERLFQFFDRHKQEDIFDTTDYTNSEYWGPATPPYMVTAGNLFNIDAIHAVLFFNDEYGKGLFIYHKVNNDWHKIFEDTVIGQTGGRHVPDFIDWNGDGIKDLSFLQPSPAGMMSVIDKTDLWLMDHSLERLHYVPEMFEVDNPAPDSTKEGWITSELYYHGLKTSVYQFKGNQLIKRSEQWDKEE